MKPTLIFQLGILIGLLLVALAMYWAAEAGARAVETVLLVLLGVISVSAVWSLK